MRLLRAEGEGYAVIGWHLGVSRERARQMVKAFGMRMRGAMRHVTHYGDCAILTAHVDSLQADACGPTCT